MVGRIRPILASVCCAMFVLTCFVGVAQVSEAKPVKATGTIEFETASGASASSYYSGQTMYMHIEASAGAGMGPEFILTISDTEGYWKVFERWWAPSVSEVITYVIKASDFIGEWEAKLTYSDLENTREKTLAKEHVEVFANGFPTATIVSIVPNPAEEDELVTFTGTATDDGYIVSRKWESSIDGVIGTTSTVYSSSLSVGTHTITFTATDNRGVSDSDTDTLEVQAVANQAPIVVVDSITPNPAIKGGYVNFMGTAWDPDGDPITRYQWYTFASVNGEPYGPPGTLGSTEDIINYYVYTYVGLHFVMFSAYDGHEWSYSECVPFEVYSAGEWYEMPQPDGQPPDQWDIRVFERDVNRDGVTDSLNLFMDANAYVGENYSIPVGTDIVDTDTKATFWIELQGYVFGDYYLDIAPGLDEVIPAAKKTDSGCYGSNQRMVLNAKVDVAYGESLVIPPTDQNSSHTIVVEWLTLRGLRYLHGYFCSAFYPNGVFLPDWEEAIGVFNDVQRITSAKWPPVGDGTGIYEWMNSNGCPDTSHFREYAAGDINAFPTNCLIHFNGIYDLGVYGSCDGYDVERNWAAFWQGPDFGFWIDGEVLADDEFGDGDLNGWVQNESGGVVDMCDPGITGTTIGAMRLTRSSSTAGGVSASYAFSTPQTGQLVAEAKMAVSTEAVWRWGYFMLKDSAGAYVTHVFFKDGQIRYYDGELQPLDVAVPYDPNVWYTIRVDVDVPNQVYDIYVNGQLVKTDAAFYGSHTNVASVYFQAGYFDTASAMTMWVDHVEVTV